MRECVEKRIAGNVIGLAGGAQHRSGRRGQDEESELFIAKLMVQVPRAFDFWFGDSFETFPIEREQEAVVEYARSVYDAGERRVHLLDGVESSGEFFRDRNVGFEDCDLGACVSQRL